MRELEEAKGYNCIVGHEDILTHLKNAIRTDKVSHAYVFGGKKGSGKRLIASLFAMTLQCEEHGTEPCQQCPSCKKFLSGNHPDIFYIRHSKANSIGVDDVREQLVNDISIRPYESRYKIYIIEEADKLTVQAQNAILKTVEEPPSYGIVLLLADNPDLLLPTILSRCMVLNLKPLPREKVKQYLMEQLHKPDYQADILASFAQGNIGTAKRLAESSEFLSLIETAIQLVKRAGRMNIVDLVETIKAFSGDRQSVYDYLDVFTMWFRDVLMFKATREIDGLIFKEEYNAVAERAAASSYEGIEKILEAIRQADRRLHANVNFELTMELLFLAMKEN